MKRKVWVYRQHQSGVVSYYDQELATNTIKGAHREFMGTIEGELVPPPRIITREIAIQPHVHYCFPNGVGDYDVVSVNVPSNSKNHKITYEVEE